MSDFPFQDHRTLAEVAETERLWRVFSNRGFSFESPAKRDRLLDLLARARRNNPPELWTPKLAS